MATILANACGLPRTGRASKILVTGALQIYEIVRSDDMQDDVGLMSHLIDASSTVVKMVNERQMTLTVPISDEEDKSVEKLANDPNAAAFHIETETSVE